MEQQKRYGHFDDQHREYVITDPQTPWPWINYLGNEDFFSLISNTAGGYSFYKDAKFRRITRYRYNNVPMDNGGRYFYIKDGDTIWNPGWKPCKTPLDFYECRHGMSYTRITGKKNGIEASVLFFVPLKKWAEVQKLTLKNESSETKSLKLFSFEEWCLWNAATDMENFQRNFSTGEVEIEGSTIYHIKLDSASLKAEDVRKAAAPGDEGVSVTTLDDMHTLLNGLKLDKYPLYLYAGESALPMLSLFAGALKASGQDLAKVRGIVGADPLGELTAVGKNSKAVSRASWTQEQLSNEASTSEAAVMDPTGQTASQPAEQTQTSAEQTPAPADTAQQPAPAEQTEQPAQTTAPEQQAPAETEAQAAALFLKEKIVLLRGKNKFRLQ